MDARKRAIWESGMSRVPATGYPSGGRAGLGDGGLALGLERSARAVGTPGKEVHRVPEVSRGALVSNGLALVVGFLRRRRGVRGFRGRDGGSERAVSVGAGFVTMVIIGGGAPRDGGSERIASVAAGPADLTLVDAAGFDARRDAGSERAGATAGWPESGTIRAGVGSYADTAWFFPRVGS